MGGMDIGMSHTSIIDREVGDKRQGQWCHTSGRVSIMTPRGVFTTERLSSL